jgi:hypothetical protein
MSDNPAPLVELARYCIEHPKMAGYVARAWIEEGGRRPMARSIASYDLSLDAVCEKQRRAVEIVAEDASRIWWRALPTVVEIHGWTDEDTFGDGAGNYTAVRFIRPYYLSKVRIVVDPDMRGELESIIVTPEGGDVLGRPSDVELRSLCGVEKEWTFTDADRPDFVRKWGTPFPADVEFFRGDDQ